MNPVISASLLAEDRFPAYTPTLREEVLSAMLSSGQHLPVQLSPQPYAERNVVSCAFRFQLIQKPQPLLRERQRQLVLPRNTDEG